MKLRNKKTGRVVEWFNNTDDILPNSLAELNEEWEDYENSKEYYFITSIGKVLYDVDMDDEDDIARKQTGNYFETKEEAEKAVEKLKAWKRLKDGGVKFDLATLSDETTIVMFARKKNHIHDYDKEIFMLFEDKE